MPSSLSSSQITAAGFNPASRQRSTLPSVCPGRASTPADCALIGKMCPGIIIFLAVLLGSTATWIVLARSCAEMPVLIPAAASKDTPNAVW